MKSATLESAKNAALLFRFVEELKVGCGYERSFKMSNDKLLANRFLLGLNTEDLTHQQIFSLFRRIGMPRRFLFSLEEHLDDANLLFLGFEDNEPGSLFKVYLEFWDKINRDWAGKESHSLEPAISHLGYKWKVGDDSEGYISRYLCYPSISVDMIKQRIQKICQDETLLEITRQIVNLAMGNTSNRRFVYLEVEEDGNLRQSFDINLYRSGLRVNDLTDYLERIREHYAVSTKRFERLLHLVGNKRFGHLSGGFNRQGSSFLTVYYEV